MPLPKLFPHEHDEALMTDQVRKILDCFLSKNPAFEPTWPGSQSAGWQVQAG